LDDYDEWKRHGSGRIYQQRVRMNGFWSVAEKMCKEEG